MNIESYKSERHWLKVEIANHKQRLVELELQAECLLPGATRRAKSSDITEGAVIWYKPTHGCWFFKVVDEVISPASDFKAYKCGDETHGLLGGFVEC